MNSVLRRPSFSGKSDQSGSESDAPSRKSSGDKDKEGGSISKRMHRKRVSFSPRSRSNTANTFEQSLLARQVVDATDASTDKPASLSDAKAEVVAALPLDASAEYTKVESPVEGGESAKYGASEQQKQPTEQVVAKEEPIEYALPKEEAAAPAYVEETTVEAPVVSQVEHSAPVVEAPAPVEQPEYAKQAATDAWAAAQEQEISHATAQAPVTSDTKYVLFLYPSRLYLTGFPE